jgi:hypothetical protein
MHMLAKLIAEDWAELWPNVFAISFWTIILFLWHNRSLKRHITFEHEKSRAHISAVNDSRTAIPLSSEKEVP